MPLWAQQLTDELKVAAERSASLNGQLPAALQLADQALREPAEDSLIRQAAQLIESNVTLRVTVEPETDRDRIRDCVLNIILESLAWWDSVWLEPDHTVITTYLQLAEQDISDLERLSHPAQKGRAAQYSLHTTRAAGSMIGLSLLNATPANLFTEILAETDKIHHEIQIETNVILTELSDLDLAVPETPGEWLHETHLTLQKINQGIIYDCIEASRPTLLHIAAHFAALHDSIPTSEPKFSTVEVSTSVSRRLAVAHPAEAIYQIDFSQTQEIVEQHLIRAWYRYTQALETENRDDLQYVLQNIQAGLVHLIGSVWLCDHAARG